MKYPSSHRQNARAREGTRWTPEEVSSLAGKLIVFEWIDGAGKTTQSRMFADRLRKGGRGGIRGVPPIVETREPTGGHWGYLAKQRGKVPGRLIYFLRDRQEHVERVIAPALAQGCLVICDRYEPSTLAYQTALHGNPREVVMAAMGLVKAPRPDWIVWLRVNQRIAVRNRFTPLEAEQQSAEDQIRDLEKLDREYAYQAMLGLVQWSQVDGEGTAVQVKARIWRAFSQWRKKYA